MQVIETNFDINVPDTNDPKYIIIHHALAQVCSVYDVHSWHLGFDWAGIGYHYFISKEGIIYRGRKESQKGAHTKEQSMNTESIGICLEGCYQEYKGMVDKEVPEKQLNALIWLTKDIQKRHDIPVDRVKRHHDYASYKLCPGDYFPWDGFVDQLQEKEIFPDIKNHWCREAVLKIADKEIMKGYPDGEFKANVLMTRGEVAVVVDRLLEVMTKEVFSKDMEIQELSGRITKMKAGAKEIGEM